MATAATMPATHHHQQPEPPLASLVKVIHGTGSYSSKLISLVDVPAGGLLAKISGATPADRGRAYTSVQISEDKDIELNSDLVFANHSCAPSVVFDVRRMEVRAVAEKALKKGEDVTFFYPSSEWDMVQPFQCNCGSRECLGEIKGAKVLPEEVLRKYWLNEHIERLLKAEKRV